MQLLLQLKYIRRALWRLSTSVSDLLVAYEAHQQLIPAWSSYQCSHSRTYVRNSRIEHWIQFHVHILILCNTCTWPARKEKMLKSRNSVPNILRKLPPIIQAGIPCCLIWISHSYIWLNDRMITSEGSKILITRIRLSATLSVVYL